jgi:hypothetical protein
LWGLHCRVIDLTTHFHEDKVQKAKSFVAKMKSAAGDVIQSAVELAAAEHLRRTAVHGAEL